MSPLTSIVLSHGLSRLASRKDCKPAVRDSKPRLWSLLLPAAAAADDDDDDDVRSSRETVAKSSHHGTVESTLCLKKTTLKKRH